MNKTYKIALSFGPSLCLHICQFPLITFDVTGIFQSNLAGGLKDTKFLWNIKFHELWSMSRTEDANYLHKKNKMGETIICLFGLPTSLLPY